MKILAVAEFDPANVLGGHKRALRKAGIDYRIAVNDIYRPSVQDGAPDWCARLGDGTPNPVDDFEVLTAFAFEADVIIFNPVIGQPWSYLSKDRNIDDADVRTYPLPDGGHINWASLIAQTGAKKVYYFHGSRNFQEHRKFYFDYYANHGELWASTINHVACADAAGRVKWAPPTVLPQFSDGKPWPNARIRGFDDPVFAVQAPTDISNCHTAEFRAACRELAIPHHVITRQTNDEVIKMKAVCNLGFDHMRGGFSVNTIENMFLGLAPSFKLTDHELGFLEGEAPIPDVASTHPWPFVYEDQPLKHILGVFQENQGLHVEAQDSARHYAERHFVDNMIAERLLRLLGK